MQLASNLGLESEGFRLTISVATGVHVPTLLRPCWVMGFAQIRSFFFGGEGRRGDGERIRQQTWVEKHLTAANCPYLASGGFVPDPTGASPLDPAWGLPSTRPPVPTLTSQPGYATAADWGGVMPASYTNGTVFSSDLETDSRIMCCAGISLSIS